MKRYFLLLSTTVFVSVLCSGVAMGAGKNYALLIGVNKYTHNNEKANDRRNEEGEEWRRLDDLRFCVADMKGLKQTLEASNSLFQKNITLLTSDSEDEYEKPTLWNINSFLDVVLPTLTPADTVLIAFAGHGISLPTRKGGSDFKQYLCPMDAEVFCIDGKYQVDGLIPRAQLDRKLLASPARVKVMIIDACRDFPEQEDTRYVAARSASGPNPTTIINSMDVKSFNAGESSQATGLFRLASCSINQKSNEVEFLEEGQSEKGNGVYTHFLIKGLKGEADGCGEGGKRDGNITLKELHLYARAKTRDYVKINFGVEQIPTISELESSGEDFIIAYCKKPELPSVPATASTGTGGMSSSISLNTGFSSPIGGLGNNPDNYNRNLGIYNRGGSDSGRTGNSGRSNSGYNSGTRSYAGGGAKLPK